MVVKAQPKGVQHFSGYGEGVNAGLSVRKTLVFVDHASKSCQQ
jgi:hypothetical protein